MHSRGHARGHAWCCLSAAQESPDIWQSQWRGADHGRPGWPWRDCRRGACAAAGCTQTMCVVVCGRGTSAAPHRSGGILGCVIGPASGYVPHTARGDPDRVHERRSCISCAYGATLHVCFFFFGACILLFAQWRLRSAGIVREPG